MILKTISFAGWVLLAFSLQPLQAQLQQWDYGKRSTEMESRQFPTPMKDFSMNESTMSKRFATPAYSTDMSRFHERTSRFQRQNTMPLKKYRANELNFKELPFDQHRFEGKQPSLRNLEKIRYNTLHHRFNERHSSLLDNERRLFRDQLDGVSLADLNRYHFRRSHSDQSGLPVTEAAGQRPAQPTGQATGRTIQIQSQ